MNQHEPLVVPEMRTVLIFLLNALAAHAQLGEMGSPGKALDPKPVGPLASTNPFFGKAESAPLRNFSLNTSATMTGQLTNRLTAQSTNFLGNSLGMTNALHSALASIKPDATTNANTRAVMNRVTLEADKLVCPGQPMQVQPKLQKDGK